MIAIFQQYVRSLRKLASLSVDVLLPGHLSLVLSGGQAHIQKALDYLGRRVVPPNIL
jgi:glyoxylase-like metal-dependent hydrolase (beta-lactamase superfamily II)